MEILFRRTVQAHLIVTASQRASWNLIKTKLASQRSRDILWLKVIRHGTKSIQRRNVDGFKFKIGHISCEKFVGNTSLPRVLDFHCMITCSITWKT